MKFLKIIIGLLSLLIIVTIAFLYTNYKKPIDQKSFLYLKARTKIILAIEFLKNTNIHKNYLFFKGKKKLTEDFSEKIFENNINILKSEYILDEQNILISNISFDGLKYEISSNLGRADKGNKSHNKRLKETSDFNLSEPEENFDIFKIEFENLKSFGILEKKNRKKLIIYNQGHLGNPYNKEYFLKIKKHYKNNGYDFLILNMLGRGFNFQGDVNFPNRSDKLELDTYFHDNIKYFYNKKYKHKKPLSLFLTGNYYLINHVLNKNNYEEIIFFGVSGGGWYGLFLSPLIDEISKTFIFSGNVPKYLMTFIDTRGDWETSESEIYQRISYWTLYKMIYKNPKNTNKKLYLVYNTKDKCCFRDPAASVMKKFEQKIKNNRFVVGIYERKNFHGIDPNFLNKIFEMKH